MRRLERTRQQLDPVGTLGGRLLAVLLAGGAFYYGLIMTFRSLDQISNLFLAVLALLWLAGAVIIVILGTSPRRAPFSQSSHIVVHLLALGSIALSVASQWGTNRMIQDDFGSIALGILMLAIGPYRPATELAAVGSLSAVFVGFLTLLEVPSLGTGIPPVSYVLVGMLPVLALSYASAVYSGGLVSSLEQWQRSAVQTVVSRTDELLGGIVRSVQRDRVTILGRDVLPFFTSILGREAVTAHDRERAREIADSIRTLMVAEADRTWLEVVAGDDGVEPHRLSSSVIDPKGLASHMGPDQRIVLRAIIVAVLDEPSSNPRRFSIELTGTAAQCRGTITAAIDANDFFVRSVFAPYFAVMRIVFSGFRVEFQRPVLTLKFSYAQR